MNLNHIAKKPFFDLFYSKPLMPQLLRAAIYDATTLNTDGSFRGPRATAALKGQLQHAHSKEIKTAISEVKKFANSGNHITHMLSLPDLIQLAGYAAVEYCGGPQMVFRMGRCGVYEEDDVVKHDHESYYNSLNAQRLAKMQLSPEDFVALMGGTHTLGFMSEQKKGPKSRWTMNPYVFDNTYFQQIMLGNESRYFQADADRSLVQSADHKMWVDAYAQD